MGSYSLPVIPRVKHSISDQLLQAHLVSLSEFIQSSDGLTSEDGDGGHGAQARRHSRPLYSSGHQHQQLHYAQRQKRHSHVPARRRSTPPRIDTAVTSVAVKKDSLLDEEFV